MPPGTTEWPIDRMLCPFCGCRDHQALGYLHVEGDQQNRAATCEQCGCYNKTIATLVAIPAIELAVYDLATIRIIADCRLQIADWRV